MKNVYIVTHKDEWDAFKELCNKEEKKQRKENFLNFIRTLNDRVKEEREKKKINGK